MKAALWIEITIAGAIHLVGALLWLLALSGIPVSSLGSFADNFKEYLPYLAVAFGATAYIVGVLAHRTLQLLPGYILRQLANLIRIERTKYEPGQRTNAIRIWQYGSERLHRELDFQYSLVALLRSLLVSLPISGSGLAVVLHSSGMDGAAISIIATALVWLACLIAFRRQWYNYVGTEQAAAEALKEVERKALSGRPSSS